MTQLPEDVPFGASPDPNPKAPAFDMPSGACDSHFHVFPTGHEHRYVPDRSYTPPPAEMADYDRVAAALGIERAVVIQPSVYAEDNAATLRISGADPKRLRAVGARGIRVNVVDSGGMTFPSVDDAMAFTARIADLAWHIELLAHVEAFNNIDAVLASSHVPVVFGHLGYTNAKKV